MTLKSLFPAVLLALALACESESPSSFEDRTDYQRIQGIMGSPVNAATLTELNILLGRNPGAPFKMMQTFEQEEGAFLIDGNTGEKLWATVAASQDSGDVVCQFDNGGSIEEYNEFIGCRQSNSDCDMGFNTDLHVNTKTGTVTVVITELLVICQESLSGD